MKVAKKELFNLLKQNITSSAPSERPMAKTFVLDDPNLKKGMDYAIRILAIKDYSIHKMKEKLKTREILQEDIEAIIEILIHKRYLREEEYTDSRIKQLIKKNYGNDFILQKLEQENLISNSENIDAIRYEFGMSSDDQLRALIEKKLRSKTIPTDHENKMKLKNKVISFLSTKGYNYDQINSAIQEFIK